MSLGSKSCSRSKHKWNQSLERYHREAIAESSDPNVVEPGRMLAEADEHLSIMEENDNWSDSFFDDEWDEHDDWERERRIAEEQYEWDMGRYDDMGVDVGIPGSFYKHTDGRTLLCCWINNQTHYVCLLTGMPVEVNPFQLEKVA